MNKHMLWGLLCFMPQLYAHPHSFVDIKTTFIANDTTITGFSMVWTFDELSSADILYDLITNNSPTSAWQIQAQQIMDNVIEHHYFTEFYSHFESVSQKNIVKLNPVPLNVSLTHDDLKAILSFTVNLEQPQPINHGQYRLMTFEPTFYVDMAYQKPNDIKLSPNMLKYCSYKIITPHPNEALQNYALSLDREDVPAASFDLGLEFAQQVNLQCHSK